MILEKIIEFNLILVTLLSLVVAYIIIWLTRERKLFLNNFDLQGVQKFHFKPVARVGGIAIFFSFSIGLLLLDKGLILWLASLPVFIVGLYEDLSARVSPLIRLISAFFSIMIAFFLLNVEVGFLGFEWVDYVLSNYLIISLLFTLLVVGGAVNSLNIIDGFNGLLGGYCILSSLAIAYVAYALGDGLMLSISLTLSASVFGFIIFNFPFGKIFIGDGGAYFLGFMLAIIGLMLVDRHVELSNWFVLSIFIYPMYELLYSIYRRKIIHKVDATQPDANHLHSLIYRKLISCKLFKQNKTICNSMVSPLMWLLSLVGIIPAIIWFDNQTMLITSVFAFMFIYTVIYKYVSSDRFKFNH
jgi:UDP-GlcNAc:undecaprenyl-phosphate/decaprenyl-phosphate GlcNAc-1-phosphate transferase